MTRNMYTFEGWYLSPDDGTTYAENPYDFSSPVTDDVVLYAKWSNDASYFFITTSAMFIVDLR